MDLKTKKRLKYKKTGLAFPFTLSAIYFNLLFLKNNNMDKEILEDYLKPGKFTDSDAEIVINFTQQKTKGIIDPLQKAIKLYYAVRDGFAYNPFRIDLRPDALKASNLLSRNYGYCVEKANLLAAVARAAGIPSRLGFAQVRNHLGAVRLEKILRTDLLVFHGYTELYLNSKWVKATPAFNKTLCQRLKVKPLEFDGKTDSLFQQMAPNGKKFMEYVYDYGQFQDVPYDLYVSELHKYYPHMFEEKVLYGDEYFIY